MIRIVLVAVLWVGSLVAVPAAAIAAAPVSTAGLTAASAPAADAAVAADAVRQAPNGAQALVQAAATQTPAQAVASASAYAAASGTTAFISVRDRSTGAILAQTGNADAQVGSESIFKLFLAAYYLRLYGGYSNAPSSVTDQLSYMIRYSDDATANSLYTDNAVPTMVAAYGLGETSNSTDRSGHWGASRITAHDMAQFLFDASQDSQVGPWLFPVMAQVNVTGSDGFDQHFGFNALSGTHGSKQGWGCDSYFTAQQCAIHSVGYTDRYVAAVLQLADADGYPDPMRSNATYAAGLIQASSTTVAPPPPPRPPAAPAPPALGDGSFVRDPRSGAIYRLAGGAPIYVFSWNDVGGVQPYTNLGSAQFAALRTYPADGTFIRVGAYVYRIAGGAPLYVSSFANVGGAHSSVQVDGVAVDHAGQGGVWAHLRLRPADGTFVRANPAIYRIAGGAPVYVSSWANVGGAHPYTDIDVNAINDAGAGVYSHLLLRPADGTYIRSSPYVYRIAGGAPIYVSTFANIPGPHPYTDVDGIAINQAGQGGVYSHLLFRPADGTYIRGNPYVYVMAGGAPIYVTSFADVGGAHPYVDVDTVAISGAGGGVYSHLLFRPANGTYLNAGGPVFKVAGGAPLYVTSFGPVGLPSSLTVVDPKAISQAGIGGVYTHLSFYPANGTSLEGLPGGRRYVVTNGLAAAGLAANPVTITQTTIDRAGGAAPFNHLRRG